MCIYLYIPVSYGLTKSCVCFVFTVLSMYTVCMVFGVCSAFFKNPIVPLDPFSIYLMSKYFLNMTSRYFKFYIVISGGQYLNYKYFIYGVCNTDCNKLL